MPGPRLAVDECAAPCDPLPHRPHLIRSPTLPGREAHDSLARLNEDQGPLVPLERLVRQEALRTELVGHVVPEALGGPRSAVIEAWVADQLRRTLAAYDRMHRRTRGRPPCAITDYGEALTSPAHVREVQDLAVTYADKPKKLAVEVLKLLIAWHRATYSARDRRKRNGTLPAGEQVDYPDGRPAFVRDGWCALRALVPTLPAAPLRRAKAASRPRL